MSEHSEANVRDQLNAALAAVRESLELTAEFPVDVLAETERAIANVEPPNTDATEFEFVTIDPTGSMDLDQALHLERDPAGDGFIVRYAIADVPAFVAMDGALDAETRKRGQTVYAPDGRIPLHPPILSEEAGSLLPDQTRGSYLFTHYLDAAGAVVRTDLTRALIRSREKLDYDGVQERLDVGEAGPMLELLREVGLLRIEQERERGGASLNRPEQRVITTDTGYAIESRPTLPVEDWNAQISLMTGMAAAKIMLDGAIGILRTMPSPEPAAIEQYRRRAAALRHPWPADMKYGDFLRTLDARKPIELALLHAASSLFRGAGYTAFDGEPPEIVNQAALAAPYTHATAPLRRLVDRFVLMVCLALVEGREVPESVRAALPELGALMQASDRKASDLERMTMNAVEAAVLCDRVGEEFDAVVLSGTERKGSDRRGGDRRGNSRGGSKPSDRSGNESKNASIQLLDPVVTARCPGDLRTGQTVRVRLTAADIAAGSVSFELVEADETKADEAQSPSPENEAPNTDEA